MRKKRTINLERSEFEVSNFPVRSFRKRYQIPCNEICIEGSEDDSESNVKDWIAQLASVMDRPKIFKITKNFEFLLLRCEASLLISKAGHMQKEIRKRS